ncbi:MAG: ATP-grasp domain-containing protein [Wenzhouxiangella sp.]|nr:MAG: ATP-grasp domain-containing protein [Wenzhouxiangella sp.]
MAARGVEVHVGDSSRLAMSRFSRYCKSFTRLPDFFLEPDAYIDAVNRAMQKTGARVLLPCFEDVELFIRHRERLPQDALLAVPALNDWAVAEDKLDYVERVAAAGCPVPATWRIESREQLRELTRQLEFPVVVKVRMGNGARGVEIVEQADKLEATFFGIVDTYDLPQSRWPIVQQGLNGKKYKLDGVFDRGKCVGTGTYRILRCKGAGRFGTSTYRITDEFPELTEYCIRALEALNWHGIFNTDWICSAEGLPHLIDINGRLSGGVAVPTLAGMDLPWLWYQVAVGVQEIMPIQQTPDVRVRWLLGDAIGMVEHLKTGKVREAVAILRPIPGCRHDDLSWSDPFPLFGEAADYFWKFARSRGSTRPDIAGMVR